MILTVLKIKIKEHEIRYLKKVAAISVLRHNFLRIDFNRIKMNFSFFRIF